MTVPEDVRLCDRAAYLADSGTLVFADVHLGRATTAGIDVPLERGARYPERLSRLLETFRPRRVVLAGDLLDSFRHLPSGVAERLDGLVATAERTGADVVLLEGNHDTMLSETYGGMTRADAVHGETLICHGHEAPSRSANRYIIGHEHPAIRIQGRKRPCFLYGPDAWNGGDVLVLPAFSNLVRGTAMNNRRGADCDAPILQGGDLDSYHPIVRDELADETLTFPRLGALRSFL